MISSHESSRSDKEWSEFVRGRRDEGFLRWVARFRRVNVLLQEAHIPNAFALLQGVLRSVQSAYPRIPAFHLVVCGFRVHFDQNQNGWEVVTPNNRGTTEAILDTNYGFNAQDSLEKTLRIAGFRESSQRRFWSRDAATVVCSWLDHFCFCCAEFRADAVFGGAGVDLTVNSVYYTRKEEGDEKDAQARST